MILADTHKKDTRKKHVGGLQTEFKLWITKAASYSNMPGMVGFKRFLAEHAIFLEEVHDSVRDRKSTRLNSSHQIISYAVFCLKKKKYITTTDTIAHLLPFTSLISH